MQSSTTDVFIALGTSESIENGKRRLFTSETFAKYIHKPSIRIMQL